MVLGETVIAGLLLTGTALMIMEAIIPGANFVVVGSGMLTTGIVAALLPFSAPVIILPFVFILSSATTFYVYQNKVISEESAGQTSDSSSLEYQEGIVEKTVTQTDGKIRLTGDVGGMSSEFQARCPEGEIDVGTKDIVTDTGGGSILRVVPVEEEDMNRMYNIETE